MNSIAQYALNLNLLHGHTHSHCAQSLSRVQFFVTLWTVRAPYETGLCEAHTLCLRILSIHPNDLNQYLVLPYEICFNKYRNSKSHLIFSWGCGLSNKNSFILQPKVHPFCNVDEPLDHCSQLFCCSFIRLHFQQIFDCQGFYEALMRRSHRKQKVTYCLCSLAPTVQRVRRYEQNILETLQLFSYCGFE